MNRNSVLVPVLLIIVFATVTLIDRYFGATPDNSEFKTRQFNEFCRNTRAAMDLTARAFELGTLEQKDEYVAKYITGQQMYYSYASVALCLETVPDLNRACRVTRDWPCLAKEARNLEQLLAKSYNY